jgi:predicted PurR-regulated permease PerM
VPYFAWIQERLSALSEMQGPLATSAKSVITMTASSLIKILVMCITAIYFALEPDLYVEGVLQLIPPGYRVRGRKILRDMGKTLALWSVGQFVDMVVVGTLVAIGFSLLRVPLAFALAVLAGLLKCSTALTPFSPAIHR